jgi:GTPase Era involved in 16S rRNA processing
MNQKEHIISMLQKLLSIAEENGSSTFVMQIKEELEKVEKNEFYLVVLGQFKRGKTTFINALLGEELLPAGIVPLTAVVTFLRYGDKKNIEVVFSNGDRRHIDAADLEQFVTERGNPNNEKHVEAVRITYPSSFLKDGIVVVDTPGIGSIALHNTRTTENFLPHIDAAIFILSPDPPITQVECEFLDQIRNHISRIFFVLNKIDTMSDHQISEMIAYTRRVIEERMGAPITLYPVSSLKELQAKSSGPTAIPPSHDLQTIEQTVQSYLRQEKENQLLCNSLKRIQRLSHELRFGVALRLKAIETPIDELQQKIATFGQMMEFLGKERQRQKFILNGEITSLRQRMAEEIEVFQKAETRSLLQSLMRRTSDHKDAHDPGFLKSLEQSLMDEMITDFERQRLPYEQKIKEQFSNFISRNVDEINLFINKIITYSANLFEVKIEAFPPLEPPQINQNFTYKINDDPTFMEIDTLKLSSRVLPSPIVRRLVIGRIKKKIEEKVMINCGRLMSGVVTYLDEENRNFQHEYEKKTENIIADIRHILSFASKRKEKEMSAHAENSDLLRQELEYIDDLIEALPSLVHR